MSELRDLRAALGLTQGDVAKRSGLAPSTISQLESGAQGLGLRATKALANGLGVDPVKLMLASKATAVKAEVERGEASGDAVLRLIRNLIGVLDQHEVTKAQAEAFVEVLSELADTYEQTQKSEQAVQKYILDGDDNPDPDENRDAYGRSIRKVYGDNSDPTGNRAAQERMLADAAARKAASESVDIDENRAAHGRAIRKVYS